MRALSTKASPTGESSWCSRAVTLVMLRMAPPMKSVAWLRLSTWIDVVALNCWQIWETRAGSVEGGLKYYVGAANLPTDGGYAEKVMAEHARLYQVAKGKPLPSQPPLRATTTPAPAPGSPPVKVAALS